jgi:PAS domain S-box-containing protein
VTPPKPISATPSSSAAAERRRQPERRSEPLALLQGLRESRDHFRALFDLIDEGFCIIEMLRDEAGKDIDYRFLEVNPAFVRVTGLTDAVGKTARELVPGVESYWIDSYGAVARTGEPRKIVAPAAAMSIDFDVYAVRVGGAGSLRVAILLRNLTERERIARELRDSNERLRQTVDLAQIGAVRVNLQTLAVETSAQTRANFGMPAEGPFSNRQMVDLVYPDDRRRAVKTFWRAVHDHTPYSDEFRCIWPGDGSIHWVAVRGHVYYRVDGTPDILVGVTQDVTARRASVETLEARVAERTYALGALNLELQKRIAERNRAEADLRRVAALVEYSTDFVGYAGLDKRTLLLNPAGRRLVGLEDSQELHLMRAYLPEEDLEGLSREVTKAVFTKGHWEGEARLRHFRTGEIIPVQQHAFAIKDPRTGVPVGLGVVARDIRLQKKAEESLQRLAALAQHSTDFIAFTDMDGRVMFLNPGGKQMVGLALQADETHRYASEFFVPDDLSKVQNEVLPTALAAGQWEGELRLRNFTTGQAIPVLHHLFLVREQSSGRPLGLATISRDISARKAAEEALQRSEERARLAIEMVGLGTWTYDQRTGQIDLDERMAEIWGLRDGQRTMTAEQVMAGVHVDDLPRVMDALAQALDPQGPGYCTVDHRLYRPDGSIRWVTANCRGHFDGEGDQRVAVALLGSALDLTERKMTEQALARTQSELAHVTRLRSLGELAASISHEINQPLAAIMTNSQAGLRWFAADPPNLARVRESLTRVVRDAARAGEIIHRVRGFVKKGGGGRTTININTLVGDTIALARSEARAHDVPLLSTLAGSEPMVHGVAAEMQQVLLNLLINGLEAMDGVPIQDRVLQVTTVLDARAAGVRITVSDTGCGLADGDTDTIFEAFQTTKPGGMGMGLAISRSIVEAHGGRIWATRNSHGGASFHVWLPLEEPSRREAGHNKNS